MLNTSPWPILQRFEEVFHVETPPSLASLLKAKASVFSVVRQIIASGPSQGSGKNTGKNTRPGTKDRSRSSTGRKEGQYSQVNMKRAIKAVKEGFRVGFGQVKKLSVRQAAQKYCVPRSTLQRRLAKPHGSRRKGRTVLTLAEESALVEYIIHMAYLGLCLTRQQVAAKVMDIIEARPRKSPIRFKPTGPGKKWFKLFFRRWPSLTLKKSQALDKGRAAAMSKATVDSFYGALKAVLMEYHSLGPDRIFNCDETSFVAGMLDGGCQVLCIKGCKRAYRRAVQNRENVTVMTAASASGYAIPELYIFKGTRTSVNFVADARPGAIMAMQPNGWITRALFLSWLEFFAKQVPGGVR